MADVIARIVDEEPQVVILNETVSATIQEQKVEVTIFGADAIDPFIARAVAAVDEAEESAEDAQTAEDGAEAAEANAIQKAAEAAASAMSADTDAATAAAAEAAVLAAIAGVSLTTATISAASIAILEALDTTSGLPAILLEAGKLGVFYLGDYASFPDAAADATGKGLYVRSTFNTAKVWVRRVPDDTYHLSWWLGEASSYVEPQDTINAALKLIPPYSTVVLPNGEILLDRATVGTVNGGSSSTNSGVIGAIYVDKPGIHLTGQGDGSHLNGQGQALNCVMFRASHCRASRFKAGNVAGQLISNEAAAIVFQPSNFVQGSNAGADIEDFAVEDCTFYDADTGVTAVCEMDMGTTPRVMYYASKVRVHGNRMSGIRRQGVELFNCDDCQVYANSCALADKGIYQYSRFVRVIGSVDVIIRGNSAVGWDHDDGELGVEVSSGAYYSDFDFYRFAGDVTIGFNHFDNFSEVVRITEAMGFVKVEGNHAKCEHGNYTNWFVRITSTGLIDSGGAHNLANKVQVDRVFVRNNDALNIAVFADISGRTLLCEVHDNSQVGNDTTYSAFVIAAPSALSALNVIKLLSIRRNKWLLNPAVTPAGVNRFGNLGSSVIDFSDNEGTTDNAGALYAYDGSGTIQIDRPSSNRVIGPGYWASDYDPPRGNYS